MRTDAELIKHLDAALGTTAARTYHHLPLFVLAEQSEALYTELSPRLDQVLDGALALPFDDFVLDLPFGMRHIMNLAAERMLGRAVAPLSHQEREFYRGTTAAAASRHGQLWVRVRRASAVRVDPASAVHPQSLRWLEDATQWAVLEIWNSEGADTLPPKPSVVLIPLSAGVVGSQWNYYHLYSCACEQASHSPWCRTQECPHKVPIGQAPWLSPSERQMAERYASKDEWTTPCTNEGLTPGMAAALTVLALAYIDSGLGGVVTEIRAPRPDGRAARTEQKKPWLAEKPRTFILIDPERAADYGHPSQDAPAADGRHHKSPRPHGRRGHWRHLPHKIVRVRATWVGAMVWEFEGRTYRICLPSQDSGRNPGENAGQQRQAP